MYKPNRSKQIEIPEEIETLEQNEGLELLNAQFPIEDLSEYLL